MELTERQQEIFENVKANWGKRVGTGNVDEDLLKEIIILADTEGDGLKRIQKVGSKKTYLVPIEDILLIGVRTKDLDKYPTEEK